MSPKDIALLGTYFCDYFIPFDFSISTLVKYFFSISSYPEPRFAISLAPYCESPTRCPTPLTLNVKLSNFSEYSNVNLADGRLKSAAKSVPLIVCLPSKRSCLTYILRLFLENFFRMIPFRSYLPFKVL